MFLDYPSVFILRLQQQHLTITTSIQINTIKVAIQKRTVMKPSLANMEGKWIDTVVAVEEPEVDEFTKWALM